MTMENIALHLETEGKGTRGTDLFIDMMGAELQTGVTLRKWGGYWKEDYYGGIREAVFQCVVRAADYQAASAKMEIVLPALTVNHKTIGTAYFYCMYPMQEPIPFGREASGVSTFVVNCKATYRMV